MQRIRKHLTPSTIIAFLALVFALTGGAFAATNHSGGGSAGSKASASLTRAASRAPVVGATESKGRAGTKSKTGPRGPAGPKGATGATGPAGPTGPTGATGAKGENGANGSNGAGGESVKITPEASECSEGGVEFSNASGKASACNGEEGPPGKPGAIHPGKPVGSPEPLPANATETGAWSFGPVSEESGAPDGYLEVPVASFAIPLAAPLIDSAECEAETGPCVTHYFKHGETATKGDGCGEGSAEKPEAEPGNFCVYAGREEHIDSNSIVIKNPGDNEAGVGTTGAYGVFKITESEEGYAHGTWAVTAP
jgi:hypothetical protein